MRITGGKARGKTLLFPSASRERPTTDFLREALFNLIGSLEDKTFLDLFAGSGSVGMEAASREAKKVYFVESNRKLADIIKKNIPACCPDETFGVMAADIHYALRDLCEKKIAFDIIFADPPYHRGFVAKTLTLLKKYDVLRENGVIVIQHSVQETISEAALEAFHCTDQRKYGANALTFLKMEKE